MVEALHFVKFVNTTPFGKDVRTRGCSGSRFGYGSPLKGVHCSNASIIGKRGTSRLSKIT